MPLSAGIVGLPNVGKSTLFNAISTGEAAAENYPFCTIEPNTGVVEVADDRLCRINGITPAKKVIPAVIELIDIAGLVKGASKGEGLGNQFLGNIKNVDAIVHVVRCFEDPNVTHVDGGIDPVRDITTIETELVLKDLETVENGITRMEKTAKSGDKEAIHALAVFQRVRETLNRGTPAHAAVTDADERAALRELCLLTMKPVLYVANVTEDGITGDNSHVTALREYAASQNAEVVVLCGKIEEELAQLDENERTEFLTDLGLTETGMNVLSRAVYKLLGLQSFFTSGPDENRAWTVRQGAAAPEAAGVIHTDFQKGFIKAEVYTLEDLETHRTEAALRAAGKIRQEGKEYTVRDGDIIFFKFNV